MYYSLIMYVFNSFYDSLHDGASLNIAEASALFSSFFDQSSEITSFHKFHS